MVPTVFTLANNVISEEQQLKLAMARSMQEDEVDDDYDENEIVEQDSQTDYMSKSVSANIWYLCVLFWETERVNFDQNGTETSFWIN